MASGVIWPSVSVLGALRCALALASAEALTFWWQLAQCALKTVCAAIRAIGPTRGACGGAGCGDGEGGACCDWPCGEGCCAACDVDASAAANKKVASESPERLLRMLLVILCAPTTRMHR